jgi:hypothetical protein
MALVLELDYKSNNSIFLTKKCNSKLINDFSLLKIADLDGKKKTHNYMSLFFGGIEF